MKIIALFKVILNKLNKKELFTNCIKYLNICLEFLKDCIENKIIFDK